MLSVLLLGVLASAPAWAMAASGKHKTRVILLGTAGGPAVYAARSEPANLLVVDGVPYLIDVGYGAVRQLVVAGVNPVDVGTVFITHQHLDHNSDLAALIMYQWAGFRQTPSDVYGPVGTEALVKAAVDYLRVPANAFGPQMPLSPAPENVMRAHEIMQAGLVYKDKRVKVTAAENAHYIVRNTLPGAWPDKSFSYRFETKDRVVVFTGDTGPSEAVVELARHADILVSEVIDIETTERLLNAARDPDGAPLSQDVYNAFWDHLTREHMPAEDLGKLAAAAEVKMLVMTHRVPTEPDSATDARLIAGVRKYYDGPVVAGNDLDEF